MEGTTVGQSISEAVPASTTVTDVSVPSGAWQALTREVRQSWDSYGETLAAAERSKNEAHGFLLEIGKRLSEAKERLARPGRSGGWSSFTRSAGLSRAEADGLVRRYRRTLVPEANCGEKAIAAQPVAPEQSRESTLTPAEHPAAEAVGPPEAAEGAAAFALATGQESQPPEQASAIAEGRTDGTVAAPIQAGQAAPVAAADGDVL